MKRELRIESELMMFLMINKKLVLISKDLEKAKYVRSIFKKENDDKMNSMIADSIVMSLYHIYCDMEEILERISMKIDNKKPDDENFSEELLEQVSLPTEDRIAVINVTPNLRDLMDFQNAFRNGYGKSFHLNELIEKLNALEYFTLPEFIQNLENLQKFLETDIENLVFDEFPDMGHRNKNKENTITRYEIILKKTQGPTTHEIGTCCK